MDIIASARSRSIKLSSKRQTHAFSRSNTTEYGSLMWTFDSNNHLLHPRLMDLVYSKTMMWTMAVIIVPSLFLPVMPKIVEYIFWLVVLALVGIPYLVLLILSFNRDASGFIIKSSEFWIKIAYSIAKVSLQFARYHLVLRKADENEVPALLGYASFTVRLLSDPLIMIVVGGIDAIPRMTHKWKAILMAGVAAIYTVDAIKYQFLEPRELDHVMIIEATRSEVSLNAMLSNAAGMMAIFLWKQAVDVVRNKDRCISITYRPYLRWTGSSEDPKLIDQKQLPQSSDAVQAEIDTNAVRDTRTRGFSLLNT